MKLKRSGYIFDQQQTLNRKISDEIILKTVNSKSLLKTFYRLPFTIYKNNSYWVPPLWKEILNFCKRNNPFWQHADMQMFIAYKKQQPVGRIAAIIDFNLPKETQKRIGYFGLFECIDDGRIASQLFDAAQSWLQSKKIDIMRGPINGRIDLGSGLVIKGFHSIPFLMGTYNPEYYHRFFKQYQMKKSRDLLSYLIDIRQPISKEMEKTKEKCEKAGIKIRPFNRWRFKRDIRLWYGLLLEVFADHYGYTPSSQAEMERTFGIKELRLLMNPRLFLFAELKGETIGFRFSLPDYNPIIKTFGGKIGINGFFQFLKQIRSLDRGRFIVMGIKKDHRGLGIGTTMNYYTLLEMKHKGYKTAEYGWIDETNIGSRKAGEKMGGIIYKIYRVFEKNIS